MCPLQARHGPSSARHDSGKRNIHDDVPWLRSDGECSLRTGFRFVFLAPFSSLSALSWRVTALWLRGWNGPLQARHRSSEAQQWFRRTERPLRRPVAQERCCKFPTDWLNRLQNWLVTWSVWQRLKTLGCSSRGPAATRSRRDSVHDLGAKQSRLSRGLV